MSKKKNTKCKQLNGTRCKYKEIAQGKQSDASANWNREIQIFHDLNNRMVLIGERSMMSIVWSTESK